jgi:hypothetical protein
MAKFARKHHYVPAGYLAGFAVPEARVSHLLVFDLELRHTRVSTPNAEACEKDYHRIDMPGVAPDFYETLLAQFEATVPSAIRSLEADPVSLHDHLSVVLNFMALTAIRIPSMRRGFINQTETEIGLPFDQAVREPKHWIEVERWLGKVGTDWTHERTIRLCTDHDYAKAASQASQFFHMVMYQDTLLGLLAQRSWSAFISPHEDNCFICSDNPVGLESPVVETGATPSFADRESVVTFPLNRRIALMGRYDEEPFVADVGRQTVARVNMQALREATRCLYAPKDTAPGMQEDGSVGYLRDTLAWK